MTSSPNTSRRYVYSFKQQVAQIGLRNNPLPTLPNSWSPNAIPSFDFSLDSDQPSQKHSSWTPLPHQIPPKGEWFLWLLMAGRGAGKTDAMANYVNDHARGPACSSRIPGGHRIGIVAPTLGDAADACVNGPSGLKAHNPEVQLVQRAGGNYVVWPNGAIAKLFSTEDKRSVDRLRAGGNRCLDWWEELAAWPELEAGYDQAMLGLRIGNRPHAVASTTPRANKKLKALIGEPDTVLTHATTDANPYLDQSTRGRYHRLYDDTRIGRQELGGQLIEDIEGALWSRGLLDKYRVRDAPPLLRLVVAVDPSGGSGDGHAEVGIVAAGKGADGHGYVLRDVSERLSPERWARRAVQLYHELKADRLVAEKNFGGDMVASTIRTVDPTVAVKLVTASRGKQLRAEPVAALDEQGRIHHVGMFPVLEDQLCEWVPDNGDPSPDRLDARVWAITELLLGGSEVRFV